MNEMFDLIKVDRKFISQFILKKIYESVFLGVLFVF
jgi:hypothetical protein